MHNRVISSAGNVSPSLNPQQTAIDAKEQQKKDLLRGASMIAAGETLGLSTEDTLALISKETRRQQRKDATVTEEDVMRQFAQAKNSLAEVGTAELAGIALREEPQINPFGQAQDDIQNYSREEKVMFDVLPQEMLQEAEIAARNDAIQRPTSGTAGVRDALRQLKQAEADQAGLSDRLSGVFGGGREMQEGMAQLQGRLEDSVDYGRGQKMAEAALAGELARADRRRGGFGYNETAEANYRRAQAEASAIAARDFLIGGKGAIADEAMRRIAIANDPVTAQAAVDPRSGTYVGIDGNPLAIQGPERAISGINAPDTANMLNAPQKESAINYVARQLPDFRNGQGRSFGDYTQTDISRATQLFAQRAAQSGLIDRQVPPDIRSVGELQKAIDLMAAGAYQQGKAMYRMQEAEGGGGLQKTRVPAAQVGAGEVMNALRYTPQESGELANALYQMEVANATQINQNAKQNYFGRNAIAPGPKDAIIFSAAEAVDPRAGQTQLERISPGQKLGTQNVKAAFKGLSDPGARDLTIGVAKGGNPVIPGSDSSIRYVGKAAAGRPTSEMPAALREQEMGFARKKAERAMRKEGGVISPMRVERRASGLIDEAALKDKSTKAMLVNERAIRDNKARNEKELAIRRATIQGRDREAPREPGRMGGEFVPGTAPSGPSTSGDSYGSKIAQERYKRNIEKERAEADSVAAQIRRIRSGR